MPAQNQRVRPTPRPEQRATRTRAALFDALIALLREKQFDQVTVREITAKAQVGYATFFRRYPDKEALLHDLAEREIKQLLTMTLPILYTVETRPSTHALCAYLWEHREIWSALLTGGAANALKEEFVRQAREVASHHPRQRTWLPGDLAVVFSVAAAIEIFAWWLQQTKPPSVKQMAEIIDRLVVTPTMS